MKTQLWHSLETGDIVDIIAPGMRSLPGVLPQAKAFLKTWGLKPRVPKDIFSSSSFCANTREYRIKHLKKAIMAKDSKAIWCIRGGYGSFHLLDDLKRMKKPKCKLFIGLSDTTSLHTMFQQEWGWATLHGSNIDRYGEGRVSSREARELRKVIFGEQSDVTFKLKGLNPASRRKRTIKAPVIGGNLVTLQANFGTKFQVAPAGKILFFEDIGERGYRVHRVLEHMDQLGLFKGVRGVVFGQFTGGREPNGKNLVPGVLKDFAMSVKFPVMAGLQSGHGELQRPLPLGTRSELYCGSRPQLISPTGVHL